MADEKGIEAWKLTTDFTEIHGFDREIWNPLDHWQDANASDIGILPMFRPPLSRRKSIRCVFVPSWKNETPEILRADDRPGEDTLKLGLLRRRSCPSPSFTVESFS
jgi:hypothetical protein